jgi:hypothetical protein
MTVTIPTIVTLRPAAGRARRARLVVAAAAILLAGCAAPAGPSGAPRAPPDRIAMSHPEPDPACRGTVREPMVANGLEQVTVKVTVTPAGKLALVEFLAPDLNPTAAAELRAAYAACAWKPGLTPSGEPVEASKILTFRAR